MRASGCIPGTTTQLTGTWPSLPQRHRHPLVLIPVQSLSRTSAFPAWLPTPKAMALPTLGFCSSPPPACQSPWGDDGPWGNHPSAAGVPLLHQHQVSVMLLQHRPMTASQRALCPCRIHCTATPVMDTHPAGFSSS